MDRRQAIKTIVGIPIIAGAVAGIDSIVGADEKLKPQPSSQLEARAWPSLVLTKGQITQADVPLLVCLLGSGAEHAYVTYNGSNPPEQFYNNIDWKILEGTPSTKVLRCAPYVHLDDGANYTSVKFDAKKLGKTAFDYISAAITQDFGGDKDKLAFEIDDLQQFLGGCSPGDPCGTCGYNKLAYLVNEINTRIGPTKINPHLVKYLWTNYKQENVAVMLSSPTGDLLVTGPKASKNLELKSDRLDLGNSYKLYLEPGMHEG
jgi:hypothetical protein